MKKILSLLSLFILSITMIVGCSKAEDKVVMDAEGYALELEKVGLDISDLIVYTAETDENELLGRPNQYTSKVNFVNGSIEVFESEKDVKSRQEYINSIGEATPMFAEYNYINGKALLRIDKSLTPEEAKKYEEEFMKL